MIAKPAPCLLLALLLPHASACGNEEGETRIVAGLSTDLAIGFDIHRLKISTQIEGLPHGADDLYYGAGKFRLPSEIPLNSLNEGTEIAIDLEAFRKDQAAPILVRTLKTRAAGGRSLFAAISLDEACLDRTCDADTTCVAGACVDPFIASSALDDYDPNWLRGAPDACKTPASGNPVLVFGQGESAYEPLQDNEVLPIEAGPQGGHHLWLALRATGLRQQGSQLSLEGYYPELAFELLPFRSQITLHRAGDSACELFGLRFQIDRDIPVDQVRGQVLDMKMVLEDPNGDRAEALKRVIIEP